MSPTVSDAWCPAPAPRPGPPTSPAPRHPPARLAIGVGELRVDQRQICALARSISARRVVSSCSRRFNFERVGLGRLHARRAPAPPARLRRRSAPRADPPPPAPRAPCACFSAACGALEPAAILIELRGGNVVVLVQRLRAIPILAGRAPTRGAPRPPRPARPASPAGASRSAARPAGPRPRPDRRAAVVDVRGQRGALPFAARSAPARVATRAAASPADLASRAAPATARDPGAPSPAPSSRASPSSTVRSISRPAVLNAMFTSVSSMLPETRMRLSGGLPVPRNSVDRQRRRPPESGSG